MNSESDKRKPLARKPSFKNKKPPEVKQTLTSKYRLLKANPLLMKAIISDQEDKEKLLLEKSLKTLANAMGKSSEILNIKPPMEKERSRMNSTVPTPQDIRSNFKNYTKPKTGSNHCNSSKIDSASGSILSSTVIEKRRELSVKMSSKGVTNKNSEPSTSNSRFKSNSKPSVFKATVNGSTKQQIHHKLSSLNNSKYSSNKKPQSSKISSTLPKPKSETQRVNNTMSKLQNNQTKTDTKFKTLRRSLSAQHFDKKRKELFEHLRSCNDILPKKSHSLDELRTKNKEKSSNKTEELNFSAITEENSFNTAPSTPAIPFKTPLAYDRRSIKTPNTTNNRRSLFLSTPASQEMSVRLNEWLKQKGKSLGDFHHLKCFGIHDQNKANETRVVDEENKENVEVNLPNASYEELRVTVPEIIESKKTDVVTATTNNVDLQVVAKEALQDLHKLILEGYPCDQCERWLKLIKQKYKQLEGDPQYWECRAALEQTKGNINLAVECYKTAIVQGAEVHAVDESLDQLLQKFSLLNINSKGNMKETKERARIVQDARNIFKSSIIQFAVQERTLKKKNTEGITIEKKLIATPVRRSTRLTRSAYTSTPGVQIYSTLQELDGKLRNTIDFRCNKALNDQ